MIVLITAVYLLFDNGRTLNAILPHLLPSRHDDVRRTMSAVSDAMNGYVIGQLINSTLFGVFAFVTLTILDVPSAAALALIAAIGDAIPQVGVTLITIPTAVLAYTVSPWTAVTVVILYIVYQAFENYVLSPRVFSKTLNLPPLITTVAVLFGANLLGIIGVLLALPISAAIPSVWRIWLESRGRRPDAESPLESNG